MPRIRFWQVAPLASLLLAGCGGGSAEPAPPTATPTPTPIPAPTPMPTPIPTPTPTNYLKVTDRSVSFTLPGFGARITSSGDARGQSGPYLADLSEEGRSLTVAHTAATDSYRGTYGGDTIEGVPTRSQVNDSAYVVYRVPNAVDAYQIVTFNQDSEYSQLFAFGKQAGQQGVIPQYVFPMIFFGSDTVSSDLPTQSVNTYPGSSECTVRLDEGAACADSSTLSAVAPRAAATVSTDWSTGMVTATTTVSRLLIPDNVYRYSINVDAKIDRASGRIRGTATASALGQVEYTGSVVGQFYGPQAKEVGLIVLLGRPRTGSIMLVAIGGRR
jgi:hypothetical protein